MSLDPALILAAIATFALIALATYRLMSKSGDDEDAEPRQKTASRGRGDNTGGDSDDSTIAESFPPSSSASSSRTPTTAAVTSFNGKKSIADALAGTYYARIEATTLATAAAAAASFEPDTAAVAPSWEWETWKWDDCDSYRKAIGLGVDKAMEKALLVQRARTVLARAQVFYKQWPAYARLRDSDVLPFTRQRLHLEALCVLFHFSVLILRLESCTDGFHSPILIAIAQPRHLRRAR